MGIGDDLEGVELLETFIGTEYTLLLESLLLIPGEFNLGETLIIGEGSGFRIPVAVVFINSGSISGPIIGRRTLASLSAFASLESRVILM